MRLLRSIRNLLGNYQLKSGIYHYYRGESKQAIEYLERTLQAPDTSEPDRRMALYYLTQTHISAAEKFEEAREMVKAVEEYRQALELTPDYPDIHFRMGALYARFDLRLEAMESYRRALAIHPEYLEARVQLAFLLLQNAEKEEAIAQFAAARDLSIRAIEDPYRKAAEALDHGDVTGAEEWMRETFQRRPENFAFHYRRGLRFLKEEQFEQAVDDFRQSIQFNPNFADVHNYLGVACGELERWDEAIAAFRRALEANSEYPVARLNLAFALAHAGQEREAIEELHACLAREPNNQAALSKLEELSAPKRDRSRAQGETTRV
ncbi:MAG TPA: tetratricopeptide repeat protein [Candidatus Polarisedimenticolia bacterium]|nr:tetratricopeptide repeat protein [Candidatus Polarisedimenticolia bacterium]